MLVLQVIGSVEVTLWYTNLSKFFLKISLLNEVHLGQPCTFHSALFIGLFAYILYVTITSYRLGLIDPMMPQFEHIFLKNKSRRWGTHWPTMYNFHSALFIGLFAYFLYVSITSYRLGWSDPRMPQFEQIFLKNKSPRWGTPWPTMYNFHSALFIGLFAYFLYVTITSYRLDRRDPRMPQFEQIFLKNKSPLHLRGTHWPTMYHFHSALFAYFLYVSITSYRLCWSDPMMHKFEQIFLKNKSPWWGTPWPTMYTFHSALFIGLFAYFLYVTITSYRLGLIDPMMPQFEQIFF